MFFSLKTIATVAAAGLLSAPADVSAAAIEERSTSLCNLANYGATGYPWQSSSTPGSFCSRTKPSNNKYWQSLPYSDGYDTVRCSGSSKSKYNVCNGGNKKASLPSNCNPPHKHSTSSTSIKASSTSTKATSTSISSTKATTSTSVAAASSAASSASSAAASAASSAAASAASLGAASSVASSAAASSAAASSAAALSAAASSAAASSAAASSAVTSSAVTSSAVTSSAVTSSAAPITAPVTASVTITASSTSTAAATTTSAVVDPLSDPVCEVDFQVTYLNYTAVAPNGVWMGMTMGAAAQDASYMTYTLATSVDDCLTACDQIEGCVFVNTYYDVNEQENYLPKHADGVLTCAMFSQCVGTDENSNFGGQDDPNTIVDSNGYCKSGACSS